ncbi:hypothetical protein [Azotosporobacter soli]
MGTATVQALTMMGIALPTMFVVILVFIGVTKLIHKAFPVVEEEDEYEVD